MKRCFAALTALFVLNLACAQTTSVRTPTVMTPTRTRPPAGSTNSPAVQESKFTIGLEYAIPGLAAAYAPAGVTYAKPQPIFGMWGLIERSPGEFDWGPLDNLVAEYQAAGFTGIQLLLTAESPWASADPPGLFHPGSTFPKEEYLDDYAAFVGRFVERYDGDGTNDAPGLLYPVHHFGIEREFTGFWPSSAEDYVRLLRIAYPAIHAADPQARVLLAAILMVDVFDGNPDAAELQRRLAVPQAAIRKSVPEIEKILAACDSYDIVDFHSLGDYTEIPPTAAWLRGRLEAGGCGEKPIWIGDAFSMSALVGYNGRPTRPATAANVGQVIDTLKLVADPAAAGHADAKAWLYSQMAGGLVKKIAVSAGNGLTGINIGNLEDWKTGVPAADALAVPLTGTSLFMGMMDTSVTRKESGKSLPPYRAPGKPRPAFYAVRLVNEKIFGFSKVERIELGSGVWAFRFSMPSGPLWVLWVDDGALYFPGEAPPAVTVPLPFDAPRALITKTPAQIGMTDPETQTLDASNGILSISLDFNPGLRRGGRVIVQSIEKRYLLRLFLFCGNISIYPRRSWFCLSPRRSWFYLSPRRSWFYLSPRRARSRGPVTLGDSMDAG